MKRTESIKKNSLFLKIYSKGTSYANRLLVMYVLPDKAGASRLGITVSKKVGCAVIRNRVKRLIKESYRLNEQSIIPGLNIVVVARKTAANADFKAMHSAFMHLAGKLDIIVHENIE